MCTLAFCACMHIPNGSQTDHIVFVRLFVGKTLNLRKIHSWTVKILAVHASSLWMHASSLSVHACFMCMHAHAKWPKEFYCVFKVVTRQDLNLSKIHSWTRKIFDVHTSSPCVHASFLCVHAHVNMTLNRSYCVCFVLTKQDFKIIIFVIACYSVMWSYIAGVSAITIPLISKKLNLPPPKKKINK